MNKHMNARKYTLLFTITYLVSYVTRTNYGAIISEIESSTQLSRALLSMAVTGSFITYGTGQLVSGFLGDRISPKKLITFGLALASLMNLLIPACGNPVQMTVVWCVNGFAQSFMWPPLVKMMTACFDADTYKTVSVRVSWGGSLGTMTVYLIAPLLIAWAGWRTVFIFSAVCGILMIIIWNIFCGDVAKPEKSTAALSGNGGFKMLFHPLMIGVMFAIVLQGMLRDGVTTWMPSFIAETYHLSNVIGILTGVVLPIFSILCLQAASDLYRKKFTNPLLCAGLIFLTAALATVLLVVFNGQNAAISVVCSAVVAGCMHGVNIILVCMLPAFFKKYGNVSAASGVLNSCTYVGSAISTYGIAVISEKFSWGFTLKIWLLIAALGALICFLGSRPWAGRMKELSD